MRYCVIDLEMCAVPRLNKRERPPLYQEIIQIGAVLLNDDFSLGESFMLHVKPRWGVLDRFITGLTGITKEDLLTAEPLEEALRRFGAWLPEECTLVQWSPSDETQIKAEFLAKESDITAFHPALQNWVDCQAEFSARLESRNIYNLAESLGVAGIKGVEGEHDALVDAKNTALLFAKLRTEETLTLSEHYTVGEAPALSYNPFADLFK